MALRTPDREDRIDRHYDREFDPGHLQQLEKQYTDSPDASDMDNIENFANDPKNASDSNNSSKNIDKVRDKEDSPSDAGWKNKVNGTNQPVSGRGRMAQVKKKGPMAFVIAMILGGGAGFSVLLAPAGALVWIKETVFNKVDTMSSVVGSRADLGLRSQMFSTNTSCKIKVRCRFNGISERQMKRLDANGAKLLDKNGKLVSKNKVSRRYKGGKTLVLSDGTKVSAGGYRRALRSSSELRSLSRSIFAPRYISWNDSVAKKIRADKRLVTDPDWGNKDNDTTTRQSVFSAVSGNSAEYNKTGSSVNNTFPDDPKKQKGGAKVGAGEYTDVVNKESARLQTFAKEGKYINQIPSEPAAVLAGTETAATSSGIKKMFKGALNIANPTAFAVGACFTYGATRAIVAGAKTVSLINKMRYASLFLATADKLKAGDLKAGEAEKAMTILQRQDIAGDSFGDAVGYQYPAYGTVPSKPLAASASGNGTILMMAAAMGWLTSRYPGHATGLRGTCKVLTNIGVQIAFSFFSFIPGVGQILNGLKAVGAVSARVAAKKAIDKVTEKVKAKLLKGAFKKSIKENRGVLVKMAAGATGVFLAQVLLEHYAVPYLARIISGTELTGSEDGVTAMDSITTGAGAINASTALDRGMSPLTKQQAMAFNQFNQSSLSTYVADMKSQSNPFDTSDPYSLSTSLAAAYYPAISKIHLANPLSLVSSISTVFSSLSGNIFTAASAADNSVNVSSCQDPDATNTKMAFDPMCNPIIAFNDVGMLNNTDPNDVISYMLDNKQIDGNGDPVPKSNFDKFKKSCVTNASNKIISAGDIDKKLPAKCYGAQNQTTAQKMYRLYIIDGGVKKDLDGDLGDYTQPTPADSGGTDTAGIAQPPNTTKLRKGWTLKKGQDYTHYKCAAGTKDKGKYTNKGNNTKIRLCEYKGAQINAMVSDRVVKIFKAAAAKGIPLTISSGWRSYETQASLYASHPGNAAKPGTSNHESGLAIDVGLAKPMGGFGAGSFCYPPDNSRVATCAGNPGYDFMLKTTPKYGMFKLSTEAWHYDTSG